MDNETNKTNKVLEAGMYVRTKEGYICKILKLNEPFENDGYLDHNDIKSASIQEKNITKVSHNIIDLIEVGDYVNGEKVTDIMLKMYKEQGVFGIPDRYNMFINKIDIKTVMTKEYFENNCYRVGDE